MSENIAGAIERAGDSWSYRIEPLPNPEHVLVTMSGAVANETIESYYRDIVVLMNQLVGPGMSFQPIIFDIRAVELGRVSLPVIWKSPGEVPRRITKIVIVHTPGRQKLVDQFIRTLANLFPGMSVALSLEDARDRLQS